MFEITGPMMVSDPCYPKGTKCALYGLKAKKGTWIGETILDKKGFVKELHASYFGGLKCPSRPILLNSISVDSGQVGIFDEDKVPREPREHEIFYNQVCDIHEKEGNIFKDMGVVSDTGSGDGSYVVWVMFDLESTLIIDVRIDFTQIIFD